MKLLSTVNKSGQMVRILSISDQLEEKNFLLSLGLLLGDIVEVVYPSYFGRPITLKCTSAGIFALRKEQAAYIQVEIL